MKKIIILCTLLVTGMSIAQTDLENFLVIDLPFNGSAIDESGNITSFIQVNGAFLCEDRYSTPNSAYYFDGIDDYIRIPHDTLLNFNSSYSVSFWVKLSNDIIGGQERIIGKGLSHSGAVQNWSFTFNSDQKLAYFWEPLDDTNMLSITDYELDSQKFYHIVGLVDSLYNESRLYVNGLLNQQNWAANQIPTSNDYDMILGLRENYQLGGDYDNFFDGIIDDIKIYNKAINNCEVLALYNEGTLNFPSLQPIQIIQNSDVLSANLYAESYQWYYNGEQIPGATTKDLITTDVGDYQVQLFDGDCSSGMSEEFYYLSNLESVKNLFIVSPNPVKNSIQIASNHSNTINTMKIISMCGKTIIESTSNRIDFNNKIKAGIYLLEIQYNSSNKAYEKIIIQ